VGDDDLFVISLYLMYEKGLYAKEDIGISWALAALLASLDLLFLFAELIFSCRYTMMDGRRMNGGFLVTVRLEMCMYVYMYVCKYVRMRREAENVVYWRMLCRILRRENYFLGFWFFLN